MRHFDSAALRDRLPFAFLIDRMDAAMPRSRGAPVRQRLSDETGREFLAMPAILGDYAGLKSLTVVPENRGTARPVISGLYTLFSLRTGEPLATMDAAELTARRTSAVAATAAARLARPDATRLLMVGAGHLAPYLIAGMAQVRTIRSIQLWARDQDRALVAAERAARLIEGQGTAPVEVVSDLRAAVEAAEIVSSATGATVPLIHGAWLRPGTHVDLVGGYRADMREIDDDGITRARIFVDDRRATLAEAGDLVDPIGRGILSPDAIVSDLPGLCAGVAGRTSDSEITLFKAVGTAVADLIAAIAVWEA